VRNVIEIIAPCVNISISLHSSELEKPFVGPRTRSSEAGSLKSLHTHTHECEHKLLLSALALRATASHCTVIKTNTQLFIHCTASHLTHYTYLHTHTCVSTLRRKGSRRHYTHTHNHWNNDTKLACTKTGVRERQIGSKLPGERVGFKSPCVFPDECKSTSLGRNQKLVLISFHWYK